MRPITSFRIPFFFPGYLQATQAAMARLVWLSTSLLTEKAPASLESDETEPAGQPPFELGRRSSETRLAAVHVTPDRLICVVPSRVYKLGLDTRARQTVHV